jgi:hypothetical protein
MSDNNNAELISYIQSYFKQAYRYAQPYIERKEEIQRAFDGIIDEETWATLSEINIPLLRTAVLQVVPFIVNYMFPNTKFLELMPRDLSVTYDTVKNLERVVEDQLIYKMEIKRPTILITQDAVKFGCGYGEVATKMAMQPARELVKFFGSNGEVEGETNRMTRSAPEEQLELRWLPFECVIPTPDGDNPDDVTCVFHVDTIREDQLEAMFAEDNARPDDEQILSGSASEIIEATRTGRMDGSFFPQWWIMSGMTGDNNAMGRYERYTTIQKLTEEYKDHKAPVLVPILKCYFKGEHIWLANGDTVIYHVKGGLDTLMCPIIKADSAVDGGNWYAQSDVMASKDVSDGIITFKNALMDLLTQHLHPTTVYDERAMAQANKAPDIEPYSKVAVLGKPAEAVGYLAPPPLHPALLTVGQVLEQDNATANGQPLNLGGQGTAGLMRGGGGAFESLMQSTQIREEFLGVLMEMGFLRPMIQRTLLLMQMMDKEVFEFMSAKDREFIKVSVTQDEIRNMFDVRVNLGTKLRGGINGESMAIARYVQVYKNNPYVDQQAALETVNPDREEAERLLATPEQVKQNMKMLQEQQQRAMGGTQGEQAVMGGSSQRAGANG